MSSQSASGSYAVRGCYCAHKCATQQPPHSELRRQNRTTLFSSCGCKRCQRRSACRSRSYSRRRVRTSAPPGAPIADPSGWHLPWLQPGRRHGRRRCHLLSGAHAGRCRSSKLAGGRRRRCWVAAGSVRKALWAAPAPPPGSPLESTPRCPSLAESVSIPLGVIIKRRGWNARLRCAAYRHPRRRRRPILKVDQAGARRRWRRRAGLLRRSLGLNIQRRENLLGTGRCPCPPSWQASMPQKPA